MIVFSEDVLASWEVIDCGGIGIVRGPHFEKVFTSVEEADQWYEERWQELEEFRIHEKEIARGEYVI